MSLLNLRKNKKEAVKSEAKKLAVVESTRAPVIKGTFRPDILKRPHITEKAAASTEKGIYVFEVSTNATKREIARAVSAMYKVTPVKVTVVTIPKKRITVKGRLGVRRGGKKAYVYLKKGEKIEVV